MLKFTMIFSSKIKIKNTKKIDLEFLDIDIVKVFEVKKKIFNFKLC